MGGATVDVDLDNAEGGESLVADAAVQTQVDAPGACSSLFAHVLSRVLIVQIVVPRIQKLPINQIVAALEAPREKDIVV